MFRKFSVKLLVLAFVSIIFVLSSKVVAGSDRPYGLENRGPLTKISFIHYKKGVVPVKPDQAGKPNGGEVCYGLLGKGVYWKTNLPRTLYVNTASFDGLTNGFVLDAINSSAETWDSKTNIDLYGNVVEDSTADWDNSSPDYRSELVKAYYPDSGIIAVTNVWGYFGGPILTREIVDFDILFNSNFNWGDASSNNSVMDLQNIATHELGHGWGLGDMYQNYCSSVTMFGYSGYGDIEKRTLEQADIIGLRKLY